MAIPATGLATFFFPEWKKGNVVCLSFVDARLRRDEYQRPTGWRHASSGAPLSYASEEMQVHGLPAIHQMLPPKRWQLTAGWMARTSIRLATVPLFQIEKQGCGLPVSLHRSSPKRRSTLRDAMGASCATVCRPGCSNHSEE